MPDNQVFTNPSNSHCSMLQPVQNLSKFSIRIQNFSALSVDRRLLSSVRWCSDCIALIHHPPVRPRNNSKFYRYSCDFVPLRTKHIGYYRTNETVTNVLLRQVNQD